MFVVVRHPESGGVGAIPVSALDLHRANGWIRVSDQRPEPNAFHLPEFADAPDLDAATESDSPAEPDEEQE